MSFNDPDYQPPQNSRNFCSSCGGFLVPQGRPRTRSVSKSQRRSHETEKDSGSFFSGHKKSTARSRSHSKNRTKSRGHVSSTGSVYLIGDPLKNRGRSKSQRDHSKLRQGGSSSKNSKR